MVKIKGEETTEERKKKRNLHKTAIKLKKLNVKGEKKESHFFLLFTFIVPMDTCDEVLGAMAHITEGSLSLWFFSPGRRRRVSTNNV